VWFTPGMREPTRKQHALLTALGQAQSEYRDALAKFERAFARCLDAGCRQTWIALELDITKQAVHGQIKSRSMDHAESL